MSTSVAKIRMTEVTSDENFKLVHAGRMHCDEMMPINKRMWHVGGNDNFPGILCWCVTTTNNGVSVKSVCKVMLWVQ